MRIFVKAAVIVIFVAAGVLLVSSFVSQAHAAEAHAKKPYWSKYHKGDKVITVQRLGHSHKFYIEIQGRNGRIDGAILRPCKYEDSENCVWNAQVRGNGEGHSFVRYLRHTFYLN